MEAPCSAAVVGSRNASPEALDFGRELASLLAREGVVVVSGGAEGIDAAAHRGALAASGRTWAVAGTGHKWCFPSAHRALFAAIGEGPGAMVWPFAPGYHHRSAFLARNRVLVALSDAVVVVQAGLPSGALHAASVAIELHKPLWVVPAAPWMGGFAGSRQLLDEGARALTTAEALVASLGVPRAPRAEVCQPDEPRTREESGVLSALTLLPLHLDSIASRTGQSAQATATALLTLALENVVVEDPPGFFRRRNAHKI